MIIFRYLLKEVLMSLLATTAVLLLIFMSTQFIHYLTNAAIGQYTPTILLHIMVLQIPYLLGLLIPAGLYFALLLALGRLYVDNEMTVLYACGLSRARLAKMVLLLAFIVSILVAICNLWLTPIMQTIQKRVVSEAKAAPLIQTILPGRFFAMDSGKQVFYVQSTSSDHQTVQHLFVANETLKNNKPLWSVVTAESGGSERDLTTGAHYILVKGGHRYQGTPGHNDYETADFNAYKMRVKSVPAEITHKAEMLSTFALFQEVRQHSLEAVAELEWRFSMPIATLLLALLALPLAETNARQGKFQQLIPAVFIYIFYANMMFVTRSWIQLGKISPLIGFFWLHAAILLLALILISVKTPWPYRLMRRFAAVRPL